MLTKDYNFEILCNFSEKDQCKRLGGKWDNKKKIWYVPAGLDLMKFKKWWKWEDHPELRKESIKSPPEKYTKDGLLNNAAIASEGLEVGLGTKTEEKHYAKKIAEPLGTRDDFRRDKNSWKKKNI